MATVEEQIDWVKRKALETDPQDVGTIELLKAKYEELRAVGAAAKRPANPAPSTPPVEGGGGAAFGVYPAARGRKVEGGLSEEAEQFARSAGSVALTAPAKGVAGMLDLAGEGAKAGGRAIGLPVPNFPHLTPEIDRLTDVLAGEPVSSSVGRSAFESGIMGPLSGGKTAAQILPQMVAGAVAGGTAQGVKESGGGTYQQLLAALLAGYGGGKVAANVGLSKAEILGKGRLREATTGTTPEDFAAGRAAQQAAAGEGVKLLPSQALPNAAPGLEELQGALLRSRASGAEGFRGEVAQQPQQVQMLAERLRGMGGQAPRGADDLASSVQRIADEAAAAGPKAVNAATKPLYEDPLGKAWKIKPEVAERVTQGFDKAIYENRGDQATAAALKEAQKHLVDTLSFGEVTPSLIAQAVQSAKQNLAAYSAYPKASNHARAVVSKTLVPLEELVAKAAPKLASAPKVQMELRKDLPTPFNEVMRQAGTSTGTEGALKSVQQRPEVMGMVEKANPRLAQELLQRQLDDAIDTAFRSQAATQRPASDAGGRLRVALTSGLEGKNFQQNLEMLFPGRPGASEGFRRVLEVAANASKTPGTGQAVAGEGALAQATRGGAGSYAQKVNVVGKLSQALWGNFRDNAVIEVLRRPDVMERLEHLSRLPVPRLTQATITGALPQLFEESQK
jgi:GNAT superfamily N-acetyltransferase